MFLSTFFCLLEKLQDNLDLCSPQGCSCSAAALQHWTGETLPEKHAALQAAMVSVLTSVSPAQAGETSFALERYKSPRVSNSLRGFKRRSSFLVSSGLCPSASASSWGMGASSSWRKGCRVGHSQVPAQLLWGRGTFPNASTLGSFWEWTTHVPVSHPPWRSGQGAGVRVNGSVALGKPHGPWGTALLLTTSWDLWKSSLFLPCLWRAWLSF